MKIYPLGLVGESNYQAAIAQCHEGERVGIYHEPDNPYDDLALRVENNIGQVIGYISRSAGCAMPYMEADGAAQQQLSRSTPAQTAWPASC
jgi:hypothetical protein